MGTTSGGGGGVVVAKGETDITFVVGIVDVVSMIKMLMSYIFPTITVYLDLRRYPSYPPQYQHK